MNGNKPNLSRHHHLINILHGHDGTLKDARNITSSPHTIVSNILARHLNSLHGTKYMRKLSWVWQTSEYGKKKKELLDNLNQLLPCRCLSFSPSHITQVLYPFSCVQLRCNFVCWNFTLLRDLVLLPSK